MKRERTYNQHTKICNTRLKQCLKENCTTTYKKRFQVFETRKRTNQTQSRWKEVIKEDTSLQILLILKE